MDFVTHFVGICKTRFIHMNTLHAVSLILNTLILQVANHYRNVMTNWNAIFEEFCCQLHRSHVQKKKRYISIISICNDPIHTFYYYFMWK